MITTFVFEMTDVVGAVGVAGLAAARIKISEEYALLPTKFRDRILKVYKVSATKEVAV